MRQAWLRKCVPGTEYFDGDVVCRLDLVLVVVGLPASETGLYPPRIGASVTFGGEPIDTYLKFLCLLQLLYIVDSLRGVQILFRELLLVVNGLCTSSYWVGYLLVEVCHGSRAGLEGVRCKESDGGASEWVPASRDYLLNAM